MGKRNKKLPALSQFLDYCKPKMPLVSTPGASLYIGAIVLTFVLGAFLILGIMGVFANDPSPDLAPAVLWTALIGSLIIMKSTYEIARINFAGQLTSHDAWYMVARLHAKKEVSSLHRSINPLAGAILEVGSEYWVRINKALESPFFSEDPVPEHWKKLRSRIRREAEYSMMSLIRSLYGLLHDGQGVEGDLIAELRDKQFADIAELRGLLTWRAKSRPMPERLFQAIPSASTQLWELMRLAREIEALPLTAIEHPFLFNPLPSRIDGLLEEMSETRQAEEELLKVEVGGGDAQS